MNEEPRDTSKGPGGEAPGETASETTHLRHRAARGLVTVGLRTLLIRSVGFLGVIVVAPLLGPDDYGVVAIGVTITIAGKFLADGGLNAGFIARERPPDRGELRALAAFQLVVTGTVTAAVTALAVWQGPRGEAVTLMTAALVIDSLRVPSVIVAERELNYRAIIRADVIEAFVYVGAAVGLVVAGFGVVGVGAATVLRSLVGTTVMVSLGDVGLVRPELNFAALRPTMRFGLFFQGAWLATILRDQGLNVLLVAIAGTAALGAWALAQRLLIIFTLLFESAWRVALPGFARLTEAGESGARLLERGLSFAATSSGAMVAVVVGATPAAVPALFGESWTETVSTLPWLAGGMMIAVPLVTVLGSLLWARGEAEKVFYMAAPAIAVTLALGALLAGPLGALGAGIGYFVGQVVLMLACVYRAREAFGRGAATQIAVPTLSAAAAGGIGWLVAISVAPEWAGAISGAASALGIYSVLIVTLDRPAMRRLLSVLRQSLRPATT